MSINKIDAKSSIKYSNISGATPSIPITSDHTDGSWNATDLYIGEYFLNSIDDKLWLRTENGLMEILNNSTYSTVDLWENNAIGIQLNSTLGGKSILGTNDATSDLGSSSLNFKKLYLADGIDSNLGLSFSVTGTNIFKYDNKGIKFAGCSNNGNASLISGATNINSGGSSLISGANNNNSGGSSLISGVNNNNSGINSIVGGSNNANTGWSSIMLGWNNINNGNYSIVTGQTINAAAFYSLTIGYSNTNSGDASIIAGNNNINENLGDNSIINGYTNNNTGPNSIVSGAYNNNISGECFVSGSYCTSSNTGAFCTGFQNVENGSYSSILGGQNNTIIQSQSAIIGGLSNSVNHQRSVILGGQSNIVNHPNTVILGGQNMTTTKAYTVYVPDLMVQAQKGINFGTSPSIAYKELLIGDWDMDITTSVGISHGLSVSEWKTIREISVIIRNDVDNSYYNISDSQNTNDGYINLINNSLIIISRKLTGVYDNVNYDSTSYNRGWLSFWYTPD